MYVTPTLKKRYKMRASCPSNLEALLLKLTLGSTNYFPQKKRCRPRTRACMSRISKEIALLFARGIYSPVSSKLTLPPWRLARPNDRGHT